MSIYCENCGAQLSPDVKFCGSCGAQILATDTLAFATQTAGEIHFSHTLPVTVKLPASVGPFKLLFRGVSAAFRDKKRWIPTLVLALLWFILTLLPLFGVDATPIQWLSFLTFAQGGTSGGITGLVGGVVGKGVFAYFLMSLVLPLARGQKPFSGVGGGIKQFFRTIGAKNLAQLAPLLAGAGVALIGYNFMAGTASLQNSMIGIAALLLSLRSLSGKAGFLRRFLGALKAKKTAEGSPDSAGVNRFIAGMTVGFALGVALSAVNIVQFQLPYALGALLLIAGLILKIAGGRATKKLRALTILLIGILLVPCMGLTALSASDLGDGFYSNEQLEDQFGINLVQLIQNYEFESLTVSLAPTYVYFSTNSSNNTGDIETSYMEMNLKDIVIQPGQEKKLHLSGSETVSEGGQWADKYTIQRDFEADVTLSIDQKADRNDPHNFTIQVENILWTNIMNRFPITVTVIGEDRTVTPSQLGLASNSAYPYGAQVSLEPEEAMHKRSTRATILVYLTAVKPGAETLAILKAGGGTSSTEDPDSNANPIDPNPIDQVIDTNAEKTAGESGFSLAAAVVLGVAATAAGIVGVGAAAVAAGSSGDESQAGAENSSFQMIIGKDFGDALKFGQKQRVWVRMVELRNGVPADRPDMMAGVSIFSNEVLVGAVSLRGANLEAEVQIQENTPPEGVISFLYSGAQGSFQNNMHFRLLGKGEIKLASDKVSILSTENKPFELIYELKNFVEMEPPLEITASSGVVALDMGKNDKQQTVVLIAPGPDADPWDRKSFTKVCRCEMKAMDGKLPVQAEFEVMVCFEGIGTAYATLPIDEMPDDALIECFTEAEKEKREEKALWIPLAVMKWDDKRRVLEPDTAKADALSFDIEVHPEYEFKTPESKTLAERVVAKAKIEMRVLPAPSTLKMDNMKKPSAYRLLAAQDPGEGAAPFDIRIAVSCEADQKLEPLAIKAQIKPNPDFKGMVRWFLEYPLGSAAADYITLGNVATYLGALDFIESRVYPMSGVPWASNLLWNKDDSSHYENGRGDMMRKSYIAIVDQSFPKGVDAGEFKKVQTLVHELAHVIEDQHGDYTVNAKSERHAYYLQHLSDMALGLTDLEKPGGNIIADVWYAIRYGYWLNADPMIIGDIGNIGPWFGGEMKLSVHELFDKYAYHIDTLGGRMDETRRQAVAQAFRRWYFPGNLSDVDVQRGGPTDAVGRFSDTSGPFKDTEWKFVWNQGILETIEASHSDYSFTVENYHWTGGNELKLQLEIKVQDKANNSFNYDVLSVTLDGGTFNTAARSFPSVRSFAVSWRSLNDAPHSLLFNKTGFGEVTSWMERK